MLPRQGSPPSAALTAPCPSSLGVVGEKPPLQAVEENPARCALAPAARSRALEVSRLHFAKREEGEAGRGAGFVQCLMGRLLALPPTFAVDSALDYEKAACKEPWK